MSKFLSLEDTAHLQRKALGLGVISVVVAGLSLAWFHTSVKYTAGRHVIKRLGEVLGTAATTVQHRQSQYVKENFYDVARAAEYYSDSLFSYFNDLIGKAGQQEKMLGKWKTYTTWYYEFVIFFTVGLAVVFAVFHT